MPTCVRVLSPAGTGAGGSMRRAVSWQCSGPSGPGCRRSAPKRPGGRRHICADLATRITDPDAFASALARGTGHPAVRDALSTPYDRGSRPDPVWLPIVDLLGKDGHKVCTGWQLEPVDGNIDAARNNRRAWRMAMTEGGQPDVPEPVARPVPTFEGGTMVFVFSHNRQRQPGEVPATTLARSLRRRASRRTVNSRGWAAP